MQFTQSERNHTLTAASSLTTTPESAAAAQPLLISAPQLATLLSVSERTVWRLQAAGKLPRPVKIGGQKRWRRSEVDRWIAAGCPPRTEWEQFNRRKPVARGQE
ncbi:MAG: helix-turn-helix domain-containing protein [Planctomycetes bacterium]|nr:helix-turn-helix domain-containing protein [Planctomycetota bacterium]